MAVADTVKSVLTSDIAHFPATITSILYAHYLNHIQKKLANVNILSENVSTDCTISSSSSSSFSSLSFISSPPFRLVTSSHIRFASSVHTVPTPNSIEAVRFDKGWLHPRGENILREESLAHYRLLWKSGISVRPPAFVLLSCGYPSDEQDPVAYMHQR